MTAQGMAPFVTPRALETHEIASVVADYRRGAANAKLAGFSDGVRASRRQRLSDRPVFARQDQPAHRSLRRHRDMSTAGPLPDWRKWAESRWSANGVAIVSACGSRRPTRSTTSLTAIPPRRFRWPSASLRFRAQLSAYRRAGADRPGCSRRTTGHPVLSPVLAGNAHRQPRL